jgi:SAM-dependent methyltransferase
MLTQLGQRYGTDKVNHGFCDVYDNYFSKSRLEVTKVLEIGVFFGSSILMWRDYFSNADIYGLDTFEGKQGNGSTFPDADRFLNQQRKNPDPRINLVRVDQANRKQLKSFVLSQQSDSFDLILDDASHLMRDQQQTFAILFSLVKPGGCMVIEDLHTSLDLGGYDVKSDFSNSTLVLLKRIGEGDWSWKSEYILDTEKDYLKENIDNVIIAYSNANASITGFIKKTK